MKGEQPYLVRRMLKTAPHSTRIRLVGLFSQLVTSRLPVLCQLLSNRSTKGRNVQSSDAIYSIMRTGMMAFLGHKSSKTTEVYTHVSNKDMGRIKNPLDSLEINQREG